MKLNKKALDPRIDPTTQLAGGFGLLAAKQDAKGLLRRSVMANLLWEDMFYEDGKAVADTIKTLIPQVEPEEVFNIAIEAKTQQKLRHVPLLIAREMARIQTHKHLVGQLLPRIILRADELAEFVALYWLDGKQPLSKQVKVGLRNAFDKFDAYQLAKYNRKNQIKLRDVMFLVHPKPLQGKEELFKQLAENTLPTPDTWEVALSAGQDKKASWERLISERKLGALAFVRNLRNMEQVGVSHQTILQGFETLNPRWLLPLNYLAAAKAAPRYECELESLMLRGLAKAPKLSGYTVFVVDVSGSMGARVSSRSEFTRMDAAAAMTVLAAEMCERIAVYATAGSDAKRIHQTELVCPSHGFALSRDILNKASSLGGGGIFTRQCLEYIKKQEQETPDRIIIFSDSQDCDHPNKRIPAPFGRTNYIVDVSAHTRGINYKGLWTAEVSGWSEHFLSFISALERAESA
ncbi:MAG: TROVE domain-containing protein [Chloroflexota bacterium]